MQTPGSLGVTLLLVPCCNLPKGKSLLVPHTSKELTDGSLQADEMGQGLGLNPALSPKLLPEKSPATKPCLQRVWIQQPAGKRSMGCPRLASKPEPACETQAAASYVSLPRHRKTA